MYSISEVLNMILHENQNFFDFKGKSQLLYFMLWLETVFASDISKSIWIYLSLSTVMKDEGHL